MTEKTFFKESTITQIKEGKTPKTFSDDLIRNILDLKDEEYGIIALDLLPKNINSKKFMKKGPEIKAKSCDSLEEALSFRMTPTNMYELTFDNIEEEMKSKRTISGFTFEPYIQEGKRTDLSKRKVSLVEILKARKLFEYTNREHVIGFRPEITIHEYAGASNLDIIVPSRTVGLERYKDILFKAIPSVYNELAPHMIYEIKTKHFCKLKKHSENKAGKENITICAHEIAAYFAVMDFYKQQGKSSPTLISPFPIPKDNFFDFSDKVNNQCLIQTSNDSRPRLIKYDGEREILNWGFVYKNKFKDIFYDSQALKELDLRKAWNLKKAS